MTQRRTPQSGSEVYFEFHTVGQYVKVCAIDAATGIETSIVGDKRASQRDLETIALRKLKRVLDKKAAEQSSDQNKGPGLWV